MKPCAAFPTFSIAAALVLCGALAVPAIQPSPAAAQTRQTLTNIVPGDAAVTIHAKITAIDPAKRQVTLTGRSRTPVTVTAGPDVRLEMLKVGDVVDAQYYRSVAFLISEPGESVPEDSIRQTIARPAEAPGGVGVQTTMISGLVVGIDLASHSVDLVSPQGGEVVTVTVTDPVRQAKLPSLKVGDTITAVVSEALAVSIQPSAKSWF
ncbi:hypothetical protein [Azospirillum soli]|uniref:hypothetical protein n=1 Tax=Azospirillum soli TaxID=1304799 RepID=UPI001AE4C7B3|nr:hypothetical protein [Azospirillum soli]MBP2311280.1 hypothetical protein [Azospirillum soli]